MEFREIFTIDDPFEADLIEEALEREQIPFQLLRHQDPSLDPAFSLQQGYGSVLTSDEYADEARRVIDDVLRARPLSPGEEPDLSGPGGPLE